MKARTSVLLAGALLVALSGTASAHGRINVGVAIGVPGYAYVAPPPAYYYPTPRIYYAPPPVYYAPAPWAVGPYRYWNRGWDRRYGYGYRRHW